MQYKLLQSAKLKTIYTHIELEVQSHAKSLLLYNFYLQILFSVISSNISDLYTKCKDF